MPSSTVAEITPVDLKQRLDKGESILLLDVREPHELAICNLPHSISIPLGQLVDRIGELEAHKPEDIVVYCRSGGRSQRAALFLQEKGFSKVLNLQGGILAWSDQVDPSLPKY